jgi:hypothetical protein
MAAYNKFQTFVEHLMGKVHDLFGAGGSTADALKVYLSNTTPNAATHAVKADLAEITAQNGYPAGGAAFDNQNGTRSGGTVTVVGDQVVFTASGGSFGPWRYAVLYNDTPSSPADPLLGWWDYGSAVTTLDGETVTIKPSSQATGGAILSIS